MFEADLSRFVAHRPSVLFWMLQVRQVFPGGADSALELVGTPTLPDPLRSVRVHGVVCFTGMLSNQWTVRDFYPIQYLPGGCG